MGEAARLWAREHGACQRSERGAQGLCEGEGLCSHAPLLLLGC